MKIQTKNLFLLVGPSGVGKNTIINEVIARSSDVKYVPSTTTRPMRVNESEGNPYHFVSIDTFEEQLEQGYFLEWQRVNENYYGSSYHVVNGLLEKNMNAITDMEIYGVHKVMLSIPLNVTTIFIAVSSPEEQLRRIQSRNKETAKSLALRLKRTEVENNTLTLFDYLVYNDDLEEAVANVMAIIQSVQNQKNLLLKTIQKGLQPAVNILEATAIRGDKSLQLPLTPIGSFENIPLALIRLLQMIGFKVDHTFDVANIEVSHISKDIPQLVNEEYFMIKEQTTFKLNNELDFLMLEKALLLNETEKFL